MTENTMKYRLKLFLAALMLGTSLAWVFSDVAAERSPVMQESSRMARLLANNLPLMHLNKIEWDDAVAERALTNFIESLDFEKVFFLASDVEEFKKSQDQLDDLVKRGNLDFAHDVYEVFKERVANRVAFVDALLEGEMDFSADEVYEWKRKDAEWPADEAAWDDLWRRKIKHQYLSRLVSDEIDEEDILTEEEASRQSHSDKVEAELAPADFVRRSFNRYLTVIQDNDESWVIERYLTAFARAFDPHTDFMSPNNLEDFEINMKLSLEGIGALLSNEEGAAKVERLIPGGPAERDGRLQPGDKIIAVAQGDDEAVDVLHWPLYKTVRLIRGEKGSKVVLTVIPADSTGAEVTSIDLIRDEVKLEEQAAKGELKSLPSADGQETKVGVIKLPEFYSDFSGESNGGEGRSCTRDVYGILQDLIAQGAEGIILDLRNNGGGSLSEAINLTGLFIDTGPVVQVRDRRRVRALYDRDPMVAYDGPLVVLVNRLSASASEIVAGALQDYGRAVIVGDSKTHGKGTVQTLASLSSANPKLGSVKVTTASFYRIAGGSTQLRGVTPDIVIPSFAETMEIGEDRLPNALPYSTVEQVEYRRAAGIDDLIALISGKSEARRSTDPRFRTYQDLFNRAQERQQQQTITLNLDQRLELVSREKELSRQIEEIDPETGEKEDLILNEAVNIMTDMITFSQEQAVARDNGEAKAAVSTL